MILLIVTVVLFLGLIAAGVLQIKQKVMALGACVILLVVCNFIN
jgi:exosortase/archaeosortase